MGTRPRVSIVILSHRADLLPQAFASAHAQTFADREIVVKFCDGPWWNDKLNEAVRGTSGELFTVLCDDDLLNPDYLATLVPALDAAKADIAYSDHRVIGPLDLNWRLPDFSVDELTRHCVPHFTALTRRDLFERVGGYDGAMKHTDWDFWYRCAQAGAQAVHVRDFLWRYRVSPSNSSRAFVGDDEMAQLRVKHPGIVAREDRQQVA